MKRKVLKIVSIVLAIAILFGIAPITGLKDVVVKADAAEYSLLPVGQCGLTVYWTFNQEKGDLTIFGSGNMFNYNYLECPFRENPHIETVVIKDGVTSVCAKAFENCSSIKSVTFGNAVTTIGESAFFGCEGLKEVVLPESMTTIGNNAFDSCVNLQTITIPQSVKTIGENVFFNCPNLKIKCDKFSVAYYYANSNNIKVSLMDNSISTFFDTVEYYFDTAKNFFEKMSILIKLMLKLKGV